MPSPDVEIERLREAMSFVARKAGAGLCQMTAEGKHLFLRDISARLREEGFDILGAPTERRDDRG